MEMISIKGRDKVMTALVPVPTPFARAEAIAAMLEEAAQAIAGSDYSYIGSWDAVWVEGVETLIVRTFADGGNAALHYVLGQMEGGAAERLT